MYQKVSAQATVSQFFGTCVRICVVFYLFRRSSIEVAELDQLDETRVEHNGYSDSIIAKDLDPGFGHNAQIFSGLIQQPMRFTVGSFYVVLQGGRELRIFTLANIHSVHTVLTYGSRTSHLSDLSVLDIFSNQTDFK